MAGVKCSTPGGVVGGGTPTQPPRSTATGVLNAGWRRGGWHNVCSRLWAGGSRAQRRVASWGVAPQRWPKISQIRLCSTPGGVVGGGTLCGVRRGFECRVLNAGWRRGGWHRVLAEKRITRMASAQRRVASWGVARDEPDQESAGDRCSTPGGVVGGGTAAARVIMVAALTEAGSCIRRRSAAVRHRHEPGRAKGTVTTGRSSVYNFHASIHLSMSNNFKRRHSFDS